MSYERIENKKIYQIIIDRIVDMIRTDELKVGEKLPPERELAAKFGVSRPSVREALRVREVIGLLERRPGGLGGDRRQHRWSFEHGGSHLPET